MQTEALEGRVMLSAAAVGSVDTQAVDLGGNLPTFSEFDVGEASMATVDTLTDGDPIRGEKDQPVSGEQTNLKSADDVGFNPQPQPPGNDWVIVGNPSLQEQPGADGFWHSGDGPPVTELSNQIDADPADNMNQMYQRGYVREVPGAPMAADLDLASQANQQDGFAVAERNTNNAIAELGQWAGTPVEAGPFQGIDADPVEAGLWQGLATKDGWIIAVNPSLQEQPGADGIWHSGDGWPVTALSTQIDTDSGDNMNQLGDIKGKDSLIRDLDYPEESIAG